MKLCCVHSTGNNNREKSILHIPNYSGHSPLNRVTHAFSTKTILTSLSATKLNMNKNFSQVEHLPKTVIMLFSNLIYAKKQDCVTELIPSSCPIQ